MNLEVIHSPAPVLLVTQPEPTSIVVVHNRTYITIVDTEYEGVQA